MAVIIDGQTAGFNKAMAQSQSQLNSFTGGIQQAGGVLLATFGTAAIFSGLKAAIGILADFESTMSEVKAITGATGKEFEALQADALRLGSATKFSSQEVGKLQVAYGRLGFNTKEILDATEATLDLAAATGEDLAKSADVAGSTVRGFGLEARETQRVVDVMAASFNQTALGLENFTEAMKYVAPVAAAAGLSVEETTALLGTLADAGIRGSMAGTSLRKIFTDLPKDGRPFQERLAELAEKGINVADAMDEVGRTAQTSLLILAKNNDKTKELAASFLNVTGEAAKMARTMSDNLTGDVEKFTGAWEGLILKLGDTDVFRRVTQSVTALLNAFQGPSQDDELKHLVRAIKEESIPATEAFIKKLQEIRRESGKPIDTNLVNELAEKYKLTDIQANKLFSSILEVNEALSFQERAIKQFQGSNIVAMYGENTKALELYKQGIYDAILAQQIQKAETEKFLNSETQDIFGPQIKAADEQIATYRRVIDVLNQYASGFEKTQDKIKVADATPAIIKNLTFYKKALTDLNTAFDSIALSQSGAVAEGQRFTEGTLSQLRVLAAGIAGNEEFIASVERLKASFKNIDTTIKPPDISALLDPIRQIETTAGGITFSSFTTNSEQALANFEARIAKTAEVTKTNVEKIQTEFINMGPLISGALVGIGEALGNAVAGVGNFGDDILKVVASFGKQLGEILIAQGVALLAVRLALKNPYTMIAAGVALVAISSALGAQIGKAHSSTVGGGGPGGSSGPVSANTRSINASATDAQDVNIAGSIVIKGQDLFVILSNYQNNNKFLKAGG